MSEVKIENPGSRGPRPSLTVFGTCLYTIMLSRGIVTATKLSEVMDKAGRTTSNQVITNYWRGDSQPSKKFFRDISAVLELTEEEKARLAVADRFEELWG